MDFFNFNQHDDTNFSGTVKIRNPKTLQRWIDRGWYKDYIEDGFVFNVGCGRFTEEKCQCTKCRKSVNSPLKEVLIKNNLWEELK